MSSEAHVRSTTGKTFYPHVTESKGHHYHRTEYALRRCAEREAKKKGR